MKVAIELDPLPLHAVLQAADEGKLEHLHELISLGIQPAVLTYALIQAARQGRVEVMRLLLESGADVTGCDSNGNAALIHAAHNNHAEAVRVLLAAGASTSQTGSLGSTALHFALLPRESDISDRSDVVAALLAAGADPNAGNEQGMLPLEMAYNLSPDTGGSNVYRLLVTAGARLDLQDEQGNTALHRAVRDTAYDVVTILLEAGANANVRNKEGQTPAQCAERLANTWPADSDQWTEIHELAEKIRAREKHGLFGRRTG